MINLNKHQGFEQEIANIYEEAGTSANLESLTIEKAEYILDAFSNLQAQLIREHEKALPKLDAPMALNFEIKHERALAKLDSLREEVIATANQPKLEALPLSLWDQIALYVGPASSLALVSKTLAANTQNTSYYLNVLIDLIDKKEFSKASELIKHHPIDERSLHYSTISSSDTGKVFLWAAKNGQTELVKLLLSSSKLNSNECIDTAFNEAAENGHTEIVKLLLNDPRLTQDLDSSILYKVAENGHTETMQLMLNDPRVKPDELVLDFAVAGKQKDVVKLLLRHPKVTAVGNGTLLDKNQLAFDTSVFKSHPAIGKLLRHPKVLIPLRGSQPQQFINNGYFQARQ